jgi:HD-GYP domain-containing protein (c-di-GMP phosphodiesterase class II)
VRSRPACLARYSDRVYKQAMSVAAAVEILREGSGTQFDPRAIDAFLQQLDAIVALRAAAQPAVDRGGSPQPR